MWRSGFAAVGRTTRAPLQLLPLHAPVPPSLRSNIKTLVLDEADEMLNKGFKEQIYDIYRYLPPETQVRYAGGVSVTDLGPIHVLALGAFPQRAACVERSLRANVASLHQLGSSGSQPPAALLCADQSTTGSTC